ncbi:hypothetical protein ACHAW6_001730 [Cyclotella cf. meneghiniana]
MTLESTPKSTQSNKCDEESTRPVLSRTNGNKLMDNKILSDGPKQWNARRSTLRRQSRTKEFNDGVSISRGWKNDDMSGLHHKIKCDNAESSHDECALSHIYTLSHSSMGSACNQLYCEDDVCGILK